MVTAAVISGRMCLWLQDMQSTQSMAFCLPASDMLLTSTDIQLEVWFIKKTVTDVGGCRLMGRVRNCGHPSQKRLDTPLEITTFSFHLSF